MSADCITGTLAEDEGLEPSGPASRPDSLARSCIDRFCQSSKCQWWKRRDSNPHYPAPQAGDSADWSTLPLRWLPAQESNLSGLAPRDLQSRLAPYETIWHPRGLSPAKSALPNVKDQKRKPASRLVRGRFWLVGTAMLLDYNPAEVPSWLRRPCRYKLDEYDERADNVRLPADCIFVFALCVMGCIKFLSLLRRIL